jgi:signal transduction histidine kinase/CheY-like chemotaxis protein
MCEMIRWRTLQRLYVELPWARPGTLNAFVIAALASVLALWLRVLIDPYLAGAEFIVAFPAIIAVALVCGTAAGLLSVLLCTLGSWYFLLPPRRSLEIAAPEYAVTLALFLGTAALIVLLVGAMRQAMARYRRLAFSLHRRVSERTEALEAAQASLVQAQKMEAIGQLTGGIAHDFNNMLAVVLGNLDLARRRMEDGRGDVARQVDGAIEGARRAAALTGRLLAFSRRQPLAPQVIDLNRLVSDLLELLRRTLGEEVRIEWAPGRALPPVAIDPGQLESAIVNVAVNARDAMPGGGTLRLESMARGALVELLIADSGTGMSAEVRARAFEPFFTTKAPGRGTGLGLSQVYGFLRQSGGDLAIDSVEGAGTEVRLLLPRHEGPPPEAAPRPAGEALPRARPGEVVLAVEDEDQVRRATVDALVELGYGVREARGGIEALAVLAADPSVALLLTDVVMPGMDGRELAARALRQRPDLGLIYTSGYTGAGGAREDGAAPDAPLLPKPFALQDLASALRAAFDARTPA